MAVNPIIGNIQNGRCGPEMQKMVSDMFKQKLGMTYTFKKGDQSDLVSLLQAALYLKGYNLYLNGMYDNATEAAVRAFQRAHGFVENGVMTPDMLRVLFPSAPAPAPMPLPAPVPPPTPRVMPMAAAAPMAAAMPPATTRPMPIPQPSRPVPLPAPQPVRPVPPTGVKPLPAPVPSRPVPMPPKPTEYNIRLSARNPEAVIKVKYDR